MRISVSDIRQRKRQTPIVVLTAYTAPVARILDPHVDILLVGDSLGMVVYGMAGTELVTMEMMIRHGKAVVAASQQALVVIDMPAGSYETSPQQAVSSAKRLIEETGAGAVKLEGGRDRAEQIRAIVQAGIPVMGHVGLLPQRASEFGGFKTQGKTPEQAESIMQDALAVQEAGAFSVVIEATIEPVARAVSERLTIPTIGIGASPACDGQVLVIDDMLGLTARAPKFVKRYADLAAVIEGAVKQYAEEVRKRHFPAA
ncbi:MAG: 3-methyl-2-oxobutanoate hydroxymethyltransferase [Rickettsiales bacterium]|nr:3-methyl-2-oxobutanoate hydroxymethyltransferase [Rickettsiales bacterium]